MKNAKVGGDYFDLYTDIQNVLDMHKKKYMSNLSAQRRVKRKMIGAKTKDGITSFNNRPVPETS